METDLVVPARSGDHDAFAQIVTSVARRFHGLACAILRDPTLAEDAAQAALVSVWRDLPRLRDAHHFEAWSHRILLNACFSEGRRARWRGVELNQAAPPVVTGPDELHVVLDRGELERGFARLSLDHRAVLLTHYYLDLLPDEADARCDPTDTTTSLLAVVPARPEAHRGG